MWSSPKINQERYDALILQMPVKPHPSSDKGKSKLLYRLCGSVKDVTCCKNLLNNCTLRPRLRMEDLLLI